MLWALNLAPIGAVSFLWFMAVVRKRLGDREDQFFSTAFLGTGLAFAFFTVVAASLGADPATTLFGSERDGRIEHGVLDQASGGSVYLNGLEDLNSEAQRALAGAIEQNGYTRVGGRQRVPLNVRWVGSAQDGYDQRSSPEAFRREPSQLLEIPHGNPAPGRQTPYTCACSVLMLLW